MFGMLDYRAHKLYWLLSLPISITVFALGWISVPVSILVSYSYFESPIIKFVGSIIILEVAGLFLLIISTLIMYFFEKMFLFFIDLAPAEGRDIDEALLVLRSGEVERLTSKLKYSSDKFDYHDKIKLEKLYRKSQGILVNFLRLFVESDKDGLFTSTMKKRVSAFVDKAKEIAEPERIGFFLDADLSGYLEEKGIAPGKWELFFVQWKYVIYKYIIFVFSLYYINTYVF